MTSFGTFTFKQCTKKINADMIYMNNMVTNTQQIANATSMRVACAGATRSHLQKLFDCSLGEDETRITAESFVGLTQHVREFKSVLCSHLQHKILRLKAKNKQYICKTMKAQGRYSADNKRADAEPDTNTKWRQNQKLSDGCITTDKIYTPTRNL